MAEDGKLVEYCTRAQLAKLRALAARHNWGDAWLEKVAGRATGRQITGLANLKFREAMALINAVEGLVEKRAQEKRQKEMFVTEKEGT